MAVKDPAALVDEAVCKENVPTGFDIYGWAKQNPDRTIAQAVFRLEKIFDLADEVFLGISGGKDSSLTAELAVLELKRRWARVAAGVNRYGEKEVDPLDAKWVGKKLWGNSQDCEWIWTDVINYIKRFVKRHGPLGDNTINVFYKCLRLGWQSGVTFGESRLTSWDLNYKHMWIRPMPTKEELGVDVITNENITVANPVPLDYLSPELQAMRVEEGSVFEKDGVKLVPNFGLGCKHLKWKGYDVDFTCWTFENQDEDNEQESFASWILQAFPEGTQIYNLISLRAAESFDRYTILRQSDYSTGEYAKFTK